MAVRPQKPELDEQVLRPSSRIVPKYCPSGTAAELTAATRRSWRRKKLLENIARNVRPLGWPSRKEPKTADARQACLAKIQEAQGSNARKGGMNKTWCDGSGPRKRDVRLNGSRSTLASAHKFSAVACGCIRLNVWVADATPTTSTMFLVRLPGHRG